jgi:hypothetical protein
MSGTNPPRCRLTNPLQRRNISAAPANVHLREVISPAIPGSTPANGTTSVPSPVARPDAPARTISSNSLFPFPPYCYSTNRLLLSYRIHLSPGSRRNSVRTTTPRKRSTPSKTPSNPESVIRQHPTPPVEQRRIYAHLPDSTPPLTQATLSSAPTRLHPISARTSATPSPSTSYSLDAHRIPPAVSSPEVDLPLSSPLNYNYRIIYYDQPYGTLVNNPSQDGSHNIVHSHSHYGGHSQPPSRSTSPGAAMPSWHINNSHYSSSYGPPSPTSVSSHTSAHSGPNVPCLLYWHPSLLSFSQHDSC